MKRHRYRPSRKTRRNIWRQVHEDDLIATRRYAIFRPDQFETFNQVIDRAVDALIAWCSQVVAAIDEGFQRPYRAAGSPYGPEGCARWWMEGLALVAGSQDSFGGKDQDGGKLVDRRSRN